MANSQNAAGVGAVIRVQTPASHTANVLGFPVLTGNRTNILNVLIDNLRSRTQCHVVTLNPEMVIAANRNPAVNILLNSADLFIADGVGIEWAANMAGASGVQRYPGVDLAQSLLEYLGEVGGSVFLLGAKSGIATEAGLRLTEKIPGLKISGSHDGYFSEDTEAEVVKKIKLAKPDVLLVGMGSPKQESFISLNKVEMGAALMIGVGGSLEVFAGQQRRAPRYIQRTGMEWAYRSVMNLTRLKRLAFLPAFLWLALSKSKRELV